MSKTQRSWQGFLAGSLIGTLGGLIGLGGAEFRLPVLVSWFRLPTLEAIILNKATSLVVVAVALLFRSKTIPFAQVMEHWDIVANLLVGSLFGAWVAAGHALTLSRQWLDRTIMLLLIVLALVMLAEAVFGLHGSAAPLFSNAMVLKVAGVIAGVIIGVIAALLGVAGGELLIPTITILYGVDIKLAGSLSLAVSLPTMIVGFTRYSQSNAFAVLVRERPLFIWMAMGSILGVAMGSVLLGLVPARMLMALLGILLIISAIKTFQHRR